MARGETQVEYNGILLRNVLTKTFRQEAVYDESNTDLLYFRYTIAVRGYHSSKDTVTNSMRTGIAKSDSEYSTSVPTSSRNYLSPGGTAGQDYATVRQRLLHPRHYFRFRTGCSANGLTGTTLLECDPIPIRSSTATGVDVQNGPKPKRAEIVQIVGDEVLAIEFEIEICMVQCDENGEVPGNSSGILSNRWSLVDTLDKNFYTTRTVSGRMVTINGNLSPHALRKWVVPRLQPGFRRESMSFTAAKDGLTLDYTIVDKEVAFAAPDPATDWSTQYSVNSSDGMLANASLNVYLAGPSDVDKVKLTRIAIACMEAKVFSLSQRRAAKRDTGSAFIRELELVDEQNGDQNSIRLQATVQHNLEVDALLGLIDQQFGVPIDPEDLRAATASGTYDPKLSFGAKLKDPVHTHGPIPVTAAWHCYLQQPCDDIHEIPTAEITDGEHGDDTRQEYTLTATIEDELPGWDRDHTSDAHKIGVYTHWKMQSTYHKNERRKAFGIAGRASTYAPGSDEPTMSVVAVGLPTWKRRVQIEAERLGGEEPVFPEPKRSLTFGRGTAELLDFSVRPATPRRTADGTKVHAVVGEYEYALTVPPGKFDTLPIGINPWENEAFNKHRTDYGLLTGDPNQ